MLSRARALASQCRNALEDLSLPAPCISTLAPAEWIADFPELGAMPTLRQLAQIHTHLAPAFAQRLADPSNSHSATRYAELDQLVFEGSCRAAERMLLIDQLTLQSEEFARMEYGFLYDPTTHLMAIGYNVTDRRRDTSYYALLASDARLAVFVGISQ